MDISAQNNLFEENRDRARREIADGATRIRSYPFEIFFGPATRCNLRCVMCVETAIRKDGGVPFIDRGFELRTIELLTRLEPCIPCWRRVAFTGSGESLLDPELPDLIGRLKNRGIETSLVSNGLLLGPAWAEKLVLTGLDELTISVDAACKETYERIRVGGRWERLLDGIGNINNAKTEHDSSTPRLTLSGNFMGLNIGELPGLVGLAAEQGADRVWATKTNIYDGALADQDLCHHPQETRDSVLEAQRRATALNVELVNLIPIPPDSTSVDAGTTGAVAKADRPGTGPLKRGARLLKSVFFSPDGRKSVVGGVEPSIPVLEACCHPWVGLTVWADGSARVCCLNSPVIGNLFEQTFEEIWNGPAARTLRRYFLDGFPPDGCRACHLVAGVVDTPAAPSRSPNRFRCCIDVPDDNARVLGTIDVSGWCFDTEGVTVVELLVDGYVVSTARRGLSRPDVLESDPGLARDLLPGFAATIETAGLTDGSHFVSVRVTNGAGLIREAGHRTVVVQNVPVGRKAHCDGKTGTTNGMPSVAADDRRLTAHLDTPVHGETITGTVDISGWIQSAEGVAAVMVLLDGMSVAEARCGLKRPDVQLLMTNPIRPRSGSMNGDQVEQLPEPDHQGATDPESGSPESLPGFSASLDTTRYPDGPHDLALRVRTCRGCFFTVCPRTVRIRNLIKEVNE